MQCKDRTVNIDPQLQWLRILLIAGEKYWLIGHQKWCSSGAVLLPWHGPYYILKLKILNQFSRSHVGERWRIR